MSKYHLYGVGNALVDMEYEVSDEQLEQLNIDKGLMTLIEKDRHDELYTALSNLPTKRSCGGSAANTVIALAQLGGQGYYSCKVASDETGDFYLADMVATGVDTNLNRQQRESGTTGKCIVMTTPDTDRSMNTFLGITADIGPTELDASALS
ncbi:MAG: adenosine kinase, partial [Granulosicoccaceae bacterium]